MTEGSLRVFKWTSSPIYLSLWEGCRVLLSPELLGLWSKAHTVLPWTLQAVLSVVSLSVLRVHMGPVFH